MRARRFVVGAWALAGALLACVGDEPSPGTPAAPGTDAAAVDALVAIDSGEAQVDATSDAALPDAGADDPCLAPGFADGGVLCDDFSGQAVEAFWDQKVSADAGSLDIFTDPSAPSPTTVLRSKLMSVDAPARAATVTAIGPAGYTSVSCAVMADPNVGAGTTVRLFQIILRRSKATARELTALVDTTGAAPLLDMIVTDIVPGADAPKLTHAPKKLPLSSDWKSLEIALRSNRAVASYAGQTAIDIAIDSGDFDDAFVEVGLLSFDPTGTRASSVRYDNLRCRFAPP